MTIGGSLRREVVVVLLAATVLTGCGDPNAGDAYADELDAFLDRQDAVVAHEVNGRNDLPYSGSADTVVTLDPALPLAGVVDAAMAIVTHRTDRGVGSNDLTVVFAAPGAKDPAATTSFYLDLLEPQPDSDATRFRLTSLVEHAVSYVAADEGIVTVSAEADAVRVVTTSDPLVVAPAVQQVVGAGEPRTKPNGEREPPDLDLTRDEDRVAVENGGDVSWLDDVRPFLETARASPDVVGISASTPARGRETEPRLTVSVAPDAPDTVKELQAAAPTNGVLVVVALDQPATTTTPSP